MNNYGHASIAIGSNYTHSTWIYQKRKKRVENKTAITVGPLRQSLMAYSNWWMIAHSDRSHLWFIDFADVDFYLNLGKMHTSHLQFRFHFDAPRHSKLMNWLTFERFHIYHISIVFRCHWNSISTKTMKKQISHYEPLSPPFDDIKFYFLRIAHHRIPIYSNILMMKWQRQISIGSLLFDVALSANAKRRHTIATRRWLRVCAASRSTSRNDPNRKYLWMENFLKLNTSDGAVLWPLDYF